MQDKDQLVHAKSTAGQHRSACKQRDAVLPGDDTTSTGRGIEADGPMAAVVRGLAEAELVAEGGPTRRTRGNGDRTEANADGRVQGSWGPVERATGVRRGGARRGRIQGGGGALVGKNGSAHAARATG